MVIILPKDSQSLCGENPKVLIGHAYAWDRNWLFVTFTLTRTKYANGPLPCILECHLLHARYLSNKYRNTSFLLINFRPTGIPKRTINKSTGSSIVSSRNAQLVEIQYGDSANIYEGLGGG